MKAISLIVVIVSANLFSQSTIQYGWQWLNPLPSGNNPYRVKFVDANTGYAVGRNSTVLKTTNGGNNWLFCLTYDSSGSRIYKTLHVFNKDTVIIAGYWGKIYKTTNGGSNWQYINSGVISYLNDIFFINSSTGYITGESYLLKSTTSGNSWFALNT